MAMENAAKATGKAAASGSSVKAAVVVGGILALEAATIGVTMYMAGGPTRANGATGTGDTQATAPAANRFEVQLIRDRFQNDLSGRTYLYDTEIFVSIREEHKDSIGSQLDSMKAQIKFDVSTIIRSAEPEVFREPTFAFLRKQIKTAIDRRLGVDEEGNSFIQEVLIVRCIPYRSDL